MARANVIQTNFTSGEVSSLLYGRVDVTKYFNGARLLENLVVKPQGGAFRRPGTRFVNGTKDNSKASILREFTYSSVQSYVLEFGNLYMRIYKDGGIVTTGGNPVEVVTPYTDAEVGQLYFTQSADVLYIAHPNHRPRKLTRTSHTAWTLSVIYPVDGPYLDWDISGTTMKLSSPIDAGTIKASTAIFAVGDVNKYIEFQEHGIWKLAQIATYVSTTEVTVNIIEQVWRGNPGVDIKLVSGDITSSYSGVFSKLDIHKYIRSDVGVWYKIATIVNSGRVTVTTPTMLTYTYPTTTLTLSNRGVAATLTASASTFVSTDTQRYIRFLFGNKQRGARIASYTSGTVVSVSFDITNVEGDDIFVRDELDADLLYQNGLADKWRLGAWSAATGWPTVVGFHEQRLIWARTVTQPQTLWMSRSGDYENMSPTDENSAVLADHAITYTIASNQANPITWIQTGPVLLIGTTGGEFQCKATSLNEALTPMNIDIKEQTRFGSVNNCPALRIGAASLFLQYGGVKIREMAYDFNIDAFSSKDVTILSSHILSRGSGAIRAEFQGEPTGTIWLPLANGGLSGVTYERDQEVVAWHRHTLGGAGIVESVAVVRSSTGAFDNVYLIVRRTINGGTKRYIERIEAEASGADAYYVDCGLSYSGAPATHFTGLDHLEGVTVQVLADGIYVGTKVVAAGAIDLTTAASKVHIGLSCPCTLQTLDPEGGSDAGTSQGKIKRISQVVARVQDSPKFKHGPSLTGMYEVVNPESGVVDVPFSLNQGHGRSGSYYLKCDEPVPFNIIALMPKLNTNE